jgi:hypothetical protein
MNPQPPMFHAVNGERLFVFYSRLKTFSAPWRSSACCTSRRKRRETIQKPNADPAKSNMVPVMASAYHCTRRPPLLEQLILRDKEQWPCPAGCRLRQGSRTRHAIPPNSRSNHRGSGRQSEPRSRPPPHRQIAFERRDRQTDRGRSRRKLRAGDFCGFFDRATLDSNL